MIDDELKNFLSGAIGIVEATSYERHMLWSENQHREKPKTWVENNQGLCEVIGKLGDAPICVVLWTVVVDNQKILFVDATSSVVDHLMIQNWLECVLPRSAFRDDGSINKTDPMNFCNILTNKPTTAG